MIFLYSDIIGQIEDFSALSEAVARMRSGLRSGRGLILLLFPGTVWLKQAEVLKTSCFVQEALNDGEMPIEMLGICSLGNSKIQWFTFKTRQLR